MNRDEAIGHANIAANNVDDELLTTWETSCGVISAAFLASLRVNGYDVVPVKPTKSIMEAMRARIDAALKGR